MRPRFGISSFILFAFFILIYLIGLGYYTTITTTTTTVFICSIFIEPLRNLTANFYIHADHTEVFWAKKEGKSKVRVTKKGAEDYGGGSSRE